MFDKIHTKVKVFFLAQLCNSKGLDTKQSQALVVCHFFPVFTIFTRTFPGFHEWES